MNRYESAKEMYAKLGVDTDAAIETCMEVPVSLHCWQGDDVMGFDHDGPLTGGIQTTGNYPGKARNPQELLADMDRAMSLMPERKKSMYMHAMQCLRTVNLQTVTSLSRSILRDGWTLRKREEWDLILTLLSSPMTK